MSPLPDGSVVGKEHESLDYNDSTLMESYARVLDEVVNLKVFLISAPANFGPDDIMQRYTLPTNEQISCVFWNNVFYITGTDIVRCLHYRFEAFGRVVRSRKKFEEGIFSDLRSLKCDADATLEEPKSEFLEFLFKNTCIRTQKKQKVFHWYSVKHDNLFLDALERDLKRESEGKKASTEAVGEPALSFKYNPAQSLADQLSEIINGIPKPLADIADASTSNKIMSRLREQQQQQFERGDADMEQSEILEPAQAQAQARVEPRIEIMPHSMSSGSSASPHHAFEPPRTEPPPSSRGPSHSVPMSASNSIGSSMPTGPYAYEMGLATSVPNLVGTTMSGTGTPNMHTASTMHMPQSQSQSQPHQRSRPASLAFVDQDQDPSLMYAYRDDRHQYVYNQLQQQNQLNLQQLHLHQQQQQQEQYHQQQVLLQPPHHQQQRVFAPNSKDDYLFVQPEEDSDFPLDYLPETTGTSSMFSLGYGNSSSAMSGINYDDPPDVYDSYVGADIRYNDEQMFLDTGIGGNSSSNSRGVGGFHNFGASSSSQKFDSDMTDSYMSTSAAATGGSSQRIMSNPTRATSNQYLYTDDYVDYTTGGQSGAYIPAEARLSGYRYHNDMVYRPNPMNYSLEEPSGMTDNVDTMNGIRKAVPHKVVNNNARMRRRPMGMASGGRVNKPNAWPQNMKRDIVTRSSGGVSKPPVNKTSRLSPMANLSGRSNISVSSASSGSLLTVDTKCQYPTPSDSGCSERSYQFDMVDDLKHMRNLKSHSGGLEYPYAGFDEL